MEALLFISGLLKVAQMAQEAYATFRQNNGTEPTKEELDAQIHAAKEADAAWRSEWDSLLPPKV